MEDLEMLKPQDADTVTPYVTKTKYSFVEWS
jgi:hypothetical protein